MWSNEARDRLFEKNFFPPRAKILSGWWVRPPKTANMKTYKIIVLRNDGSDGVHFPVPEQRNSLVFGRSVGCDVRIDRNTVSGEHAKMERDESGQWILRHLSSSNPTFLNGNSLCGVRRLASERADARGFAFLT